MKRVLTDVNVNYLKRFILNFFLNSGVKGMPIAQAKGKEMGVQIPWAILMDPTSACNLKCIGCWAAEYGKHYNLTYEKMDEIITQGKELGIYVYLFSGGEPLVRKKDLIRLAEKHSDCAFGAFTNATLIDEDFVQDLLRVGNFTFMISVEGTPEAVSYTHLDVYKRQRQHRRLSEQALLYRARRLYPRHAAVALDGSGERATFAAYERARALIDPQREVESAV